VLVGCDLVVAKPSLPADIAQHIVRLLDGVHGARSPQCQALTRRRAATAARCRARRSSEGARQDRGRRIRGEGSRRAGHLACVASAACEARARGATAFTPAGRTVRVTLSIEADIVCIEVSDTGSEIPSDFLPHVFEPFRQISHGGASTAASGSRWRSRKLSSSFTRQDRREERRGRKAQPFASVFPPRTRCNSLRDPPASRATSLRRAIGCWTFGCSSSTAPKTRGSSRWRSSPTTAPMSAPPRPRERRSRPSAGFQPHVLVADLATPGEHGFTLLRRVREGTTGYRLRRRAVHDGGRHPTR
jgi:hypothetical protein